MTRPFDAYHVWLGIPPGEQPPDHYRLLGIPLFEHDPDVIEQAAERQTAFLRQMETGPHRETVRRILREVAQARATLLNPATRATYDEVLRHLKAGQASRPAPTSPGTPRSMPLALDGRADGGGIERWSPTPTGGETRSASKIVSWLALPWRTVLYFWNHPGAAAGVATLILIAAGVYLVLDSIPQRPPQFADAARDERPAADDVARDDEPVRGAGVIPSWSEPSASGAGDAPVDLRGAANPPSAAGSPATAPPSPPAVPPASLPAAPGGTPSPTGPGVAPGADAAPQTPAELLPGMLGRISVGGEDLGVVLRYTPGDAFGQAEIDRLLARYGLEKAELEVRLEGILRIEGRSLPPSVALELAVTSPLIASGGMALSFDGSPVQLRALGDGGPPKAVLGVKPGDHRIVWTLKGPDLGAENRLTCLPGSGEVRPEIAVGYDADLLRACNSLPTLGRHGLNNDLTELSPEELAGAAGPEPPPSQAPVVATDARRPVPSYADQTQAQNVFQQKYRKELADAQRPETRSLLARTLMNEADQESDASLRYVLRTEARNLAVGAGNPFLAVQIGESIAAEFQRDVWDVHVETLGEVRKSKLALAREPALTVLQSLVRSAIREDRYEAARALAEIGEGIAQEARDPILRDAFKQASEQAQALAAAYRAIQDALAAVQSNGDDPAANETVGRFYALVKQDWKTGLPYLAKAEHAVLRSAARNDLATPASPMAQLRVADDWWAFAESLEEADKSAVRRRAGFWYLKTERFQAGDQLARVRQRLAESGRVVNLIAAATARKAAFLGTWQAAKGVLVSSPEPLPRIAFQILPAEEYDIVLKLQPLPRPTPPRPRGQSNPPPPVGQGAFMIGLPLGRSSAVAVLDWFQGTTNTTYAFLANYDGKGPDPANPTLHPVQVFRASRPNAVVCQVRPEAITVSANGVPVIEYRGDLSRLSLPREFGIGSSRRIFFATVFTPFQVTQAELRDVSE